MTRKTMLKGLLAVGLGWAWLGAGSAQASEFEVVATSFTVDSQINASSVTYFGTKSAANVANPNAANLDSTLFPTPGGLYFDGNNYKVWEREANAWVNVATGTITGSQVSGSGTAGRVPRWTGSGTLGDSVIRDNGTEVGIGVAAVAGKELTVSGDVDFTGTGNIEFANTGYVAILGMTVGKSGNVTTLYAGTGTSTPLVKIK